MVVIATLLGKKGLSPVERSSHARALVILIVSGRIAPWPDVLRRSR
jgi:hypothetical protein